MPAADLHPPRSLDSVRRLAAADWDWLSCWAGDAAIDGAIGPLDAEWFAHVLGCQDGTHLVVTDGESRPIAVMGCVWDPDGASHVVTDFAVDPRRRRSGLGRRALASATAWEGHPAARGWTAFVDPRNERAFAFFADLGWRCEGLDDDMYRFVGGAASPG